MCNKISSNLIKQKSNTRWIKVAGTDVEQQIKLKLGAQMVKRSLRKNVIHSFSLQYIVFLHPRQA